MWDACLLHNQQPSKPGTHHRALRAGPRQKSPRGERWGRSATTRERGRRDRVSLAEGGAREILSHTWYMVCTVPSILVGYLVHAGTRSNVSQVLAAVETSGPRRARAVCAVQHMCCIPSNRAATGSRRAGKPASTEVGACGHRRRPLRPDDRWRDDTSPLLTQQGRAAGYPPMTLSARAGGRLPAMGLLCKIEHRCPVLG